MTSIKNESVSYRLVWYKVIFTCSRQLQDDATCSIRFPAPYLKKRSDLHLASHYSGDGFKKMLWLNFAKFKLNLRSQYTLNFFSTKMKPQLFLPLKLINTQYLKTTQQYLNQTLYRVQKPQESISRLRPIKLFTYF